MYGKMAYLNYPNQYENQEQFHQEGGFLPIEFVEFENESFSKKRRVDSFKDPSQVNPDLDRTEWLPNHALPTQEYLRSEPNSSNGWSGVSSPGFNAQDASLNAETFAPYSTGDTSPNHDEEKSVDELHSYEISSETLPNLPTSNTHLQFNFAFSQTSDLPSVLMNSNDYKNRSFDSTISSSNSITPNPNQPASFPPSKSQFYRPAKRPQNLQLTPHQNQSPSTPNTPLFSPSFMESLNSPAFHDPSYSDPSFHYPPPMNIYPINPPMYYSQSPYYPTHPSPYAYPHFIPSHPSSSSNPPSHIPAQPSFNSPNPPPSNEEPIKQPLLKPLVQRYISNSISPGEKTVIIFTSKVAQKSYGTEKRFLCPPPTVLLLGSNWWTSTFGHPLSLNPMDTTSFAPPKLTIDIPGESGQQPGIIEWIGSTGSTIENTADIGIAGRCVAKHLFINDGEEKRKKVEAMVRVHSALGPLLGSYPSRPIKVISKPSKKRQSVKNMDLCIHHGTTISLFNRLRSQTVSTKYLGVSHSLTGGGSRRSSPNQGHPDNTCFVARTGGWDPFLIWIVDSKNSQASTQPPPPPSNYTSSSQFGFPPPPMAITPHEPIISSAQIPSDYRPMAIHYNQTIVLQCISTGMVSPTLIIRKIERGSIVVGSISNENGEEVLGDPVSQLHKVAFELKEDFPPASQTAFPNSQIGSYLSCLADVVGVQKTKDGKKFLTQVLADLGTPQTNSPSELPPSPNSSRAKPNRGQKRGSISKVNDPSSLPEQWYEDVTDTGVWTIVGTDCALYTCYSSQPTDQQHPLLHRPTNDLQNHLQQPVSQIYTDQ